MSCPTSHPAVKGNGTYAELRWGASLTEKVSLNVIDNVTCSIEYKYTPTWLNLHLQPAYVSFWCTCIQNACLLGRLAVLWVNTHLLPLWVKEKSRTRLTLSPVRSLCELWGLTQKKRSRGRGRPGREEREKGGRRKTRLPDYSRFLEFFIFKAIAAKDWGARGGMRSCVDRARDKMEAKWRVQITIPSSLRGNLAAVCTSLQWVV